LEKEYVKRWALFDAIRTGSVPYLSAKNVGETSICHKEKED